MVIKIIKNIDELLKDDKLNRAFATNYYNMKEKLPGIINKLNNFIEKTTYQIKGGGSSSNIEENLARLTLLNIIGKGLSLAYYGRGVSSVMDVENSLPRNIESMNLTINPKNVADSFREGVKVIIDTINNAKKYSSDFNFNKKVKESDLFNIYKRSENTLFSVENLNEAVKVIDENILKNGNYYSIKLDDGYNGEICRTPLDDLLLKIPTEEINP